MDTGIRIRALSLRCLPGQVTCLGNNKFVSAIVPADQLVFSVADNQLVGNGATRRS